MKKILLLLVLLPVYAWGSAVEQDPAALEWQKQQQQADKRLFKQIKAEVSAGYTDSLSELAALYYFGRGTKKNYKKAYRYFKKAAKHGNEYARYAQAFMLLRGQGVKARPSQALAIQEELAKDDFAPAQVELFYAYRDGTGTAPNQARAQRFLQTAARQNYPTALRLLGVQLRGTDPQTAFTYLQTAAEREDKKAQYLTALCYDEGIGTAKNPRRALEYMIRSAKQKYAPALWQTAQWYEAGYGTEPSAYQAFRWTRLAAQADVKEAQKRLAEMYAQGVGVRPNQQLAKKWAKEAQKAATPNDTDQLEEHN